MTLCCPSPQLPLYYYITTYYLILTPISTTPQVLMGCAFLFTHTNLILLHHNLLPNTYTYIYHVPGTNGVCFPLHIHEPYADGWQYSAVVFIGVNSIAIATIVWCYVAMFISIQVGYPAYL